MLTNLVLTKTEKLCQQFSFKGTCSNISYVCSMIVLSNDSAKITFSIEEMEWFIDVDIEFYNTLDGKIKKVRKEDIFDQEKSQILYLRKKVLRSFRKTTRDKLLGDMLDEYIAIVHNILIEQI